MLLLEQLFYTVFQIVLTKHPGSIKLATTIYSGDILSHIDN